MDTQELPDNISICSGCGERINDDSETVFDSFADPFCKDCYKKEYKK